MTDVEEKIEAFICHLCNEFEDMGEGLSKDGRVCSGHLMLVLKEFFTFSMAKVIHLAEIKGKKRQTLVRDMSHMVHKDILDRLAHFKECDKEI